MSRRLPGLFAPGEWGGITNSDMTAWVGAWGTSFASNLTPDKGLVGG